MKIKRLSLILLFVGASLFSSCNWFLNSVTEGGNPEFYPIYQNQKWGFINRQGEIVIQPQFALEGLFMEGLAVACLENNKCGYIDSAGKFVINPQFEYAMSFSEGLAAIVIEKKIGFIDKTGKIIINPQFDFEGRGEGMFSVFSEGLASVKIGDKFGFVDKEGKIVINPQFENASPFLDGLASVRMGSKHGFVDKEGKIAINPQFDHASSFFNGLAVVQIGKQYGYIDKKGTIIINPQFEYALSFSDDGLAGVMVGTKAGFIDKEGKYVINPQFAGFGAPPLTGILDFKSLFLPRVFSDGLQPVKVGEKIGYIDKTGKIVINPQFRSGSVFYGGLASVRTDDGMAYIDKDGKFVWRETMPAPQVANNTNTVKPAATPANVATPANTMPSSSERTGRLTTDSNIRSEANKDSASLGIHFKGAKVRILEETSFTKDDGEVSTWFKIRVYEYGCSADTSLGCGKNNSTDADEGWVNSKNVLLD